MYVAGHFTNFSGLSIRKQINIHDSYLKCWYYCIFKVIWYGSHFTGFKNTRLCSFTHFFVVLLF